MIDDRPEINIIEDNDNTLWVGYLYFLPRVGEYWVSANYDLYKVIEITHGPFDVKIIVNRVYNDV